MADFALLESSKWISREIWVTEKSWNFHTVRWLRGCRTLLKIALKPLFFVKVIFINFLTKLIWRIFFLILGMGTLSRILYLTGIIPVVLLIIMIFWISPTASNGFNIQIFMQIDYKHLTDPNIWMAAARYSVKTIALTLGVLIGLGSYNRWVLLKKSKIFMKSICSFHYAPETFKMWS